MDQSNKTANGNGQLINLQGMYQDYFLDYASYVILERAVPHIDDGLKPVQRRILHAMKETDDGRYNKVANVIGLTMQYHPHGDAAVYEALVRHGLPLGVHAGSAYRHPQTSVGWASWYLEEYAANQQAFQGFVKGWMDGVTAARANPEGANLSG